jgi:hypothetical protein
MLSDRGNYHWQHFFLEANYVQTLFFICGQFYQLQHLFYVFGVFNVGTRDNVGNFSSISTVAGKKKVFITSS